MHEPAAEWGAGPWAGRKWRGAAGLTRRWAAAGRRRARAEARGAGATRARPARTARWTSRPPWNDLHIQILFITDY